MCACFRLVLFPVVHSSCSPTQALELVQDSKATIFLVLELARGGELFDRIKVRLRLVEVASKLALFHSGLRFYRK